MRLLFSAALLLALLVVAELALRWNDGFRLVSVPLVAAHPVTATVERRSADLRYVDMVPLADGVNKAWYFSDPPPEKRIPLTAEQQARSDRYPTQPMNAFDLWNPRYLQESVCLDAKAMSPLEDFYVYDPIEPGEYPTFIHPAHFSFPATATMNRFGWRGPDITAAKPAATIRIAFVGASTTFSSATHSHPEYVGHWLDLWTDARHAPYRVEVVNAGESGIGSSSIAAIVRQQVTATAPDLVIYYEGSNDFAPFDTLTMPTGATRPKITATFREPRAIERYSDVARRSVQMWAAWGPGGGAEPRKPAAAFTWPADRDEQHPDASQSPLPMRLHGVVENLESMRVALERTGAELAMSSFIWMVYPGMRLELPAQFTLYRYLNETYWPASYAHMRRMADYQNRVFENYANRHGMPFFDIAAEFPKDPDLFNDAIHMTNAGLRLQGWMYFQQLARLIDSRVAAGRWPRSARPDAPADRLRAGARLVRRDDLLKQCH